MKAIEKIRAIIDLISIKTKSYPLYGSYHCDGIEQEDRRAENNGSKG